MNGKFPDNIFQKHIHICTSNRNISMKVHQMYLKALIG